MKKTILLLLLVILVMGCAKVDDASNETKETTAEEPVKVEEQTIQVKEPAQETVPAVEPDVTEEAPKVTEVKSVLNVGETKTIELGDRIYKIKLLSVSNRAQFSVNGEITKDLILNGVHTLKDQGQLKVLQLLYNSAEIRITAPPEKEDIDLNQMKGKEPQTVATGIFQTVEKTTSGHVEIIVIPDGSLVLQLQGFLTQPGSGLYIYLIDQSIADGYEVAKLTTISGGQTYNLQEDVDLNKYKKVVIYSKSEEKIYGEAILS